ncbi:acylneuraminate cytidylyltransferase family protein [Paenibacillus nanensis]|uniref:Acylneuraminate cytidylyltransferase family protein n=1 Tax=Paenibacillus nanensis TaxID=393251 RepID=A0A3A1UJL7_9BACL|nr:acylneuraminate cytidylyltransferase family protein [Paenibacillus nanensis]RIX47312.1 acylneuraminate cytidylyltransferase family protein [Paenibacillus nanensis]
MIKDIRILGIIPARGGSKGVPGKNIRQLAGKPLIAWTIEAALKSKYLDKVIVTSDDDDIIRISLAHGAEVPFKRPETLAQDDTPGITPVLHAIDQMPGFDAVVLLQPTSPLRNHADIDGSIERFAELSAPVVSVSLQEKSPYWMFRLGDEDRLEPIMGRTSTLPRQELPTLYTLNGAVYVSAIEELRKTESFVTDKTAAYIMPKERSLDIDTILDFQLCELLLGYQTVQGKGNRP